MDDIYGALGSWLRGQLTVMMIPAALYSIGLSIAGIPLAIFIGCTAGLLAFVPYVGVMIGIARRCSSRCSKSRRQVQHRFWACWRPLVQSSCSMRW